MDAEVKSKEHVATCRQCNKQYESVNSTSTYTTVFCSGLCQVLYKTLHGRESPGEVQSKNHFLP